jgi:hypothetical protein
LIRLSKEVVEAELEANLQPFLLPTAIDSNFIEG